MSLKQVVKTALSMLRYRTLRVPSGTYIVSSEVDFSSLELGRDVSLKNSVVGPSVEIGSGSSIFTSRIGEGAVLGSSVNASECELGPFTGLHDGSEAARCKLGLGSYLAANTRALAATIGNFTSIGPECLIGLPEHPVDWLTTSPHFYGEGKRGSPFNHADLSFEEHGEVRIGSDVWLGARVIVRSGVTIGDGAIVAAGAVVVKDVEPFTIVGGVPAKLIRRRLSEEDAERILALAWWNWPQELLVRVGPLLAKNDIEGLEKLALILP